MPRKPGLCHRSHNIGKSKGNIPKFVWNRGGVALLSRKPAVSLKRGKIRPRLQARVQGVGRKGCFYTYVLNDIDVVITIIYSQKYVLFEIMYSVYIDFFEM